MTVPAADLAAYALAMLGLWLTPGPVWAALMARALAGGFASAWPLAVGVSLGDLLWPLLAILGMAWVLSTFAWAFAVMKGVAALAFVAMGVLVWRGAAEPITADGRLTRPGRGAGFWAGVTVILANPKAILFYMMLLPGFFDLGRVAWADMALILLISALIPLGGNLLLAAAFARLRRLAASPWALARIKRVSGALLIGVGLLIPFL